MDEFEQELQELKKLRKGRCWNKPRPVLCFDPYTAKLIVRYPNITRYCQRSGRHNSNMTETAQGKVMGEDEIWIYEDEFSEELLKERLYRFRHHFGSHPVVKCDKDTGEALDVYMSEKSAARLLGEKYRLGLHAHLKGMYVGQPYKGFKWRYADEDEPITIRRDGKPIPENRRKLRKMDRERRKKESMFTERKEEKK